MLLLFGFDYVCVCVFLTIMRSITILGKNLPTEMCFDVWFSGVYSLPPRTCRLNNAKEATRRAVCKEGVMRDIYDRVQYIYLKIVIYNAVR